MTITLHAITAASFTRMLTNLVSILEKAEANAAERKIGPEVLGASRLAPDMLPLSFQIQSATDRAKLALARITGRDAPKWADEEKTLEELRGRLKKALDYIATYSEADLAGLEDKQIALKIGGQDVEMTAQDYILQNVHPNFYFHVATAYAILRHNGVPVGKRDFVG
jgi:uncharacterized protein